MADVAAQTLATAAFSALIMAIISTIYVGQYCWTHRRFTALFLLFWVFLGFTATLPEAQAAMAASHWQAVLLLAIRPSIMLVVLFEVVLYAWWQWRISLSEFRAARGWRPSIWRTWTSLATNVGLPTFVTHTKRARVALTLLYYLTAVAGGFWIFTLATLEPYGEYGSTTISIAPEELWFQGYSFLVIALVVTTLGAPGLIRRFADAQAINAYQSVREWDARAPIIFLRQFDQDRVRIKAKEIDPFIKFPVGAARARTIDELLLEKASPYGPLIAIGDPRTTLPPLGAARVFVPGDGLDWQTTVSALVDASKGVVICPASSEGVRWEIDLLAGRYARAWAIYLANPEVSEQESRRLIEECVGEAIPADIKKGQIPILAYQDGVPDRWLLLTARKRSLATYTIALNLALQAMFGIDGEELPRLAKGVQREAA